MSSSTLLLALWMAWTPGVARAQGLDLQGPLFAAGDGDPLDAARSVVAGELRAGRYSAGVAALVVHKPLTDDCLSGDCSALQLPELALATGAQLQGAYGVSRHFGLVASLPVWMAVQSSGGDGAALGDLALWAPIALVDGDGLRLGVVPALTLPTGAERLLLGDDGVGGELRLTAGLRRGALAVSATAGLRARTGGVDQTAPSGLRGASGPVATVSAAYAVAPSLAGQLFFDLGSGLRRVRTASGGAVLPAELGGAVRWKRQGAPLGVTVTASRGVLADPGAAALRASASLTWSPLPHERLEPTPLVAVEDAVPTEAPAADDPAAQRTVATITLTDEQGRPLAGSAMIRENGAGPFAADEQGVIRLPLAPGMWTAVVQSAGMGEQERSFRVVVGAPVEQSAAMTLLPAVQGEGQRLEFDLRDDQGEPVAGARVVVDGRAIGSSSSGGRVGLSALAPGAHVVEVRHDLFQSVALRADTTGEGARVLDMPLRRLPGSVRVRARVASGAVGDASVRFLGASRLPAAELGASGERVFVVRPGLWEVLVTSPEYGLQARRIVVPPDRTDLMLVQFSLANEGGAADLELRVIDPDGAPVDGAAVSLDGQALGATASEGTLEAHELNVGARSLAISAEHHVDLPDVPVFLTASSQQREVVMDWESGAVRVRAMTPDGFVSDAVARFSGPAEVPPLPLGPFGEALTQLAPGHWRVLVTSPELGLQSRQLTVRPDTGRLVRLDVPLATGAVGSADLRLVALDPEGRPAQGLAVALGERELGRTGADGALSVDDLEAGVRSLRVAGEPFMPQERELTLGEGETPVELHLAWAPGAVKVIARDAAGRPVTDAVVRVAGPVDVPTARVDATGQRLIHLEPGQWEMLVTSPTYGFIDRHLTVEPAHEGLEVVEFELIEPPADRAELLVRVIGPDARGVSNVSLALDGAPRGTTVAGVVLLKDLDPGTVSLAFTAEGYAPARFDALELAPGPQERLVHLEWVPVPVQVSVVDSAGEPVEAEVRFDGDSEEPALRTASNGSVLASLPPGVWRVLASAPALGVKSVTVDVEPSASVRSVTLQLDKARVTLTKAEVVIGEKIPFDLDQATIRPEAQPLLAELANTLIANARLVKVQVQGHTDPTGGLAYNLDLSQRRAEAVRDALVALGVPPERLLAAGFGAAQPIASNDDEAGRQANRRVSFMVLEQGRGAP